MKTKLPRPAVAKDLYVSDLFRGRRRYVERTCDRWFILSAKHHLVRPDDVIEPYNCTLVGAAESKCRAWGARVLRELIDELGDLAQYEFELHAGHEYRSFGLRGGLVRAGATTSYPVAGMRLPEQLQFYARHGQAGSGVLAAHPDRAREAARRLWEAWNGAGIFGVVSMPESEPPVGVERGTREHALFITLTVALDYLRDAAALWSAARQAFEGETTRWLFDTARVARSSAEDVRAALVSSRVALRPVKDAQIWQTVAATLDRRFGGDPRAMAEAVDHRAPAMLEDLRRVPGEFPWLGGPKIGPLWVRMMSDEVQLLLRELELVPIPVDVHIARATYACGGLVGSFTGTVSAAAPAIKQLWGDALEGTGLRPLDIDQALWLQSREGCARRRGDFCPREGQCVIADLCVEGQIRVDGKAIKIDTRLREAEPPLDPGPPQGAGFVWERISRHAGEPGFHTRTGKDVTYDVDDDAIVVRGVRGARIPRDHVEEAARHVPFSSLREVPQELWGRSYLFAILMDARIRRTDW